MSIADEIRAAVFVADYASPDATGKINAVGAYWQVTGLGVTGMTPAHVVVATLEAPSRYSGQEVAISLRLDDESGTPVNVMGAVGELQALRIQQVAKFERPDVPGLVLHDKVWAKANILLSFITGLPLQQNQAYTWILEVDGVSRPDWQAGFYVGGISPAVLG